MQTQRDFIRTVYKEILLPKIPNIESLDKKKYICDLSYHDESKNHPHCFWYCVDVCWDKDFEGRPSVGVVVCLFQSFFDLLKESKQLQEMELNNLQNNVRIEMIKYLEENMKDFRDQVIRYNNFYKVDLLSGNLEDWWDTAC